MPTDDKDTVPTFGGATRCESKSWRNEQCQLERGHADSHFIDLGGSVAGWANPVPDQPVRLTQGFVPCDAVRPRRTTWPIDLLYRSLICDLIGYMEGVAIGMRSERDEQAIDRAANALEEKAEWSRQELDRLAKPPRSGAPLASTSAPKKGTP